jgi:single-stranded-DNA-specific exonuclease
MLCGAGVMFKLVQAFLKKYGEYFKIPAGWEKWLLDMAGLATLSDMVPLVGENRTIASFGMQVLRKSPRPGLQQLLRKLKIDQRYLVEEDITFMMAPRLNAASRMDSPMRAFELLAEKDTLKAGMLAEHLTKINDERKTLVAHIMKDVKHKLSERELGPVIVVGNPAWRVGVLGLVAGKICDEYDRPVFVWGRPTEIADGIVKGSCRSNGSVNVVTLMESTREHFLDFGGHELAGGFSVSSESIHFLEEKLSLAYANVLQENTVKERGVCDAALTLADVNETTYKIVASLAPYGLGNPKPIFAFPDVTIKKAKQFGKEKNHIELTLTDASKAERVAIAFFSDGETFSRSIKEGDIVNLTASLEKSYFAGRITLRLRITDIN